MKRHNLTALGLAVLAVLPVSCQLEERGANVTGEVEFTLNAGIPAELTTYADGNAAFSHRGGANNVNPADYDLRYTLEVYDGDQLAYEAVQVVGQDFTTTSVQFKARLLAKQYRFVLWADFVNNGTSDLYYNTENLRAISYTQTVKDSPAMLLDDAADAYYKALDVNLTEAGQSIADVKLQRPFGKMRFIATDELTTGQTERPAKVMLNFGGSKVPTTFNADNGVVGTENLLILETLEFTAKQEDALVNNQPDTKEGAYLLGYAYFFPTVPESAYPVKVTVYSDESKMNQIGYRDLSGIPVQPNKLTTVIGNFYSNEGGIEVKVDDMFSNGEEEVPFRDPVTVASEKELQEVINALPDDNAVEQIIYIPEGLEIGGDTFTLLINKPNVTIVGPNASSGQSGLQKMGSAQGEVSGFVSGTIKLQSDNIRIDGVVFKDAVLINDYQTAVNNLTIRNCSFSGVSKFENNKSPVYIYGDSPRAASTNIVIENNDFSGITNLAGNASAIVVYRADNVTVSGNTIDGTQYHGIQFNQNAGLAVEKNIIRNVPLCGIQLAQPASGTATIRNNTILESNTQGTGDYAAIRVYSKDNQMADLELTVQDNVISNEGFQPGYTAIRLYNYLSDGTDATPMQWTEGCSGNTIVNYIQGTVIGKALKTVILKAADGETISDLIGRMEEEPEKLIVLGKITSADISKIKSRFIAVPNSSTTHVMRELDLSRTEGLTQIGSSAFDAGSGWGGNKVLEKILLPETVKSVGMMAFFWNKALKEVNVLPQLESIGENAFDGCGFEEIILGPNLSTLSKKAFAGCSNLRAVTFNTTEIRTLPEGVFNDCSSLESVTLPENLERIETRAFMFCSKLTRIVFPATLREVYSNAFGNRTLKEVISYAVEPPAVLAFEMPAAFNSTLRVPEESIELYRNDEKWSKNFTYIVPID